MLKYKNEYKVVKNKDNQDNIVNKEDNYIKCAKNTQIYRFSSDELVVQFNTKIYANNRLKDLFTMGVQLTPFQIGDNERTYTFSELELSQVAEVVKARKRKVLSDEQKEILSLHMKNMIHNKNDIK